MGGVAVTNRPRWAPDRAPPMTPSAPTANRSLCPPIALCWGMTGYFGRLRQIGTCVATGREEHCSAGGGGG